jgi:hypothetical protein
MNTMEVMNAIVFALGWVIFVLGQAQNSVISKTNGVTGIRQWIRLHAVNLITRAFFSTLAYGFIVHTVTAKAQALGFQFTATTIAGVGGWAANGLLYQFFGFFPGLRVEVADLAPAAAPNAQQLTSQNPPAVQ